MSGSKHVRRAQTDHLKGFGLQVRLVAGWISDVPHRSVTASVAVSIEAAMILTIAGIRHGANADPTAVRLVFTVWASVLFLFISGVGFIFLSIERYFCVIEKTQEFGVLKVLGASMRFFLILLLIETCVICIPGTVGGIGLTFLMGWGVASAFPKFLQLDMVYPSWPIAFGISATASMIGGVIGARRAIRTGVIQALTYEG